MSVFYTVFCFLAMMFFIKQLVPTLYGLQIFEKTRITIQAGLIAAAILAFILNHCGGILQGILGQYADKCVPFEN